MDSKIRRALGTWTGLPQVVFHQVGWWACVLWMGWLGPVIMGLFLVLHLYLTRQYLGREIKLIILSTVVGIVLDNMLALTSSVSYVGDLLIGSCPLWLMAIWSGFGATLNYSQSILVRTQYNALATGLVGGPLAYFGGEKLERLTINGWSGVLAVSLTWGVAMYLLYLLAHRETDTSDSKLV